MSRARTYVSIVRVIAIAAVVSLVAAAGASGSRVREHSARVKVTQTPIEVSGVSGDARPQVSCPSVSGCVATFSTANLLVLAEHRGSWTREATVPGVGVRSLACPSVGSCAGTGWISGAPDAVVTQSGQSWRASAVQLPGVASPSSAVLPSVSCGSVGDCTAVGWDETFKPHDIEDHALTVIEKAGTWGVGFDAQLPPDAATTPNSEGEPDIGGFASVVSCPSAGNCAVGGTYTDTTPGQHGPVYRSEGWVATETAGQWQPAVAVQLPANAATQGTGDAMSGTSPFLGFTGMSCPSTGNCTAIGGYEKSYGVEEGLILREHDGVWRQGIQAPLPRGGAAPGEPNAWDDPLFGISCADASDCAAIGAWVTPGAQGPEGGYPGAYHGWLLTERHGKWSASKLLLPRKTKNPHDVSLNSISCPSPGDCVAVGGYRDGKYGLIVVERNGQWQRAIKPALPANAAAPKKVWATLNSVSCPSTNRCAVVGQYEARSGPQGLIDNLRLH